MYLQQHCLKRHQDFCENEDFCSNPGGSSCRLPSVSQVRGTVSRAEGWGIRQGRAGSGVVFWRQEVSGGARGARGSRSAASPWARRAGPRPAHGATAALAARPALGSILTARRPPLSTKWRRPGPRSAWTLRGEGKSQGRRKVIRLRRAL